jgi:hypothetical protein
VSGALCEFKDISLFGVNGGCSFLRRCYYIPTFGIVGFEWGAWLSVYIHVLPAFLFFVPQRAVAHTAALAGSYFAAHEEREVFKRGGGAECMPCPGEMAAVSIMFSNYIGYSRKDIVEYINGCMFVRA